MSTSSGSGCTYCGLHAPCTAANCPLADGYERVLLDDKANPKDIAGASKPRMGLVPVASMESVARVMELGAKKYGPYNWRYSPIKNMVYAHAALRHLFAWIGGQTTDPESGQSHLAHVASCMMIIMDAEACDTCIEDRPTVVEIKAEQKAA